MGEIEKEALVARGGEDHIRRPEGMDIPWKKERGARVTLLRRQASRRGDVGRVVANTPLPMKTQDAHRNRATRR